jgi:hypothetical protein
MAKNIRRELDRLRLPDLQQRYRLVVGEETRCPNRTFLIRKIAEAIATRATEAQGATPAEAIAEATSAEEGTEAIADTATAETSTGTSTDTAYAEAPSDAPTEVEEPVEAPPPAVAPEHAAEPVTPAVAATSDAKPASVAAPTAPARSARPRRLARGERARARPQRGRFKAMTVEELQTAYLSIVGRSTGSTDRRYLIWKIREAEKGNLPVGPRATRTAEQQASTDTRILPLRLDAPSVAAIDATWRAQGLKSRMEFFRRALGHYLAHVGARGAAALFASPGAQ